MKISGPVSVVAPVAGVLLGVLDFAWIKFMPSPVAGLGNSIAVWAVAGFLLTYYFRWGPGRSVLAAVVMLVVAVPSYYVAAALLQNDDWSNAWDAGSRLWMVFAVVAGVVFGLDGVVARSGGWLRIPAAGLPAAVLFSEVLVRLSWIGRPSYRSGELVAYGGGLFLLAVVVTAAVVPAWRERALALGCSVPLAGAGFILLRAAGFGG